MKESKSGTEAREDATTSTWSLATRGTIHMDAAQTNILSGKRSYININQHTVSKPCEDSNVSTQASYLLVQIRSLLSHRLSGSLSNCLYWRRPKEERKTSHYV